MGNYAFGAAAGHPLVADALTEGTRRAALLVGRTDVTDLEVLRSTGPYMLSEVFHNGRLAGKYGDVDYIHGDAETPLRGRTHGGDDWHKFGQYAEHMLAHSWVARRRASSRPTRGDEYDKYDECGEYDEYDDC